MSVETRQSTSLPKPRQRLVWLLVLGSVAVALFAAGVTLAIGRGSGTTRESSFELPVLAQVPTFSAARQDGTTVTEREWAGSVWVANFVFTRCATICSDFTGKMADLQVLSERRLPQLKLVSFTVDPEYDTQERLTAYGKRYQADFGRWSFLNVSREALEKTVVPGLLQTLDRGDANDLGTVAHSSSFVLIDRGLKVRGLYGSTEGNALEAVLHDAEALSRAP